MSTLLQVFIYLRFMHSRIFDTLYVEIYKKQRRDVFVLLPDRRNENMSFFRVEIELTTVVVAHGLPLPHDDLNAQ